MEDQLSVKAFPLEPNLPAGMSVMSTKTVLIEIVPATLLSEFSVQCVFDDPPSAGAPETGEALDAQSWESSQATVMIGTEDTEFLRRRLPFLNLSDADQLTEFLRDGLRMTLQNMEPLSPISLHFVVASNPIPEPAECSTWYAVDIPHATIVEYAKRIPPAWRPPADPLQT